MSVMPQVRFLDRTTPPHIFTLILMAGVAALSLNIFLPSLPSMAEHFGVDYGLMQLSVSAYLGMTAIVQVAVGPIADRFGRRPIVLTTSGLFTIATLGALFAPNFTVFLVFRLVQTAIATGFAISRAIVRDMVPQDQAASMIAYVTMGMSLVPMLGPVLGGVLDEAFGWRASFWVLAAGGLLLFVLAWFDQGETSATREGGFAAQLREYPALLTSQRFWGYCLAAAFSSGAFFAYLGGAPFVGTNVFALEPAVLGIYFGAPAIGYLLGNWVSGRYSVAVGVDRMVLIGAVASLLGMVLLLALNLSGISHPLSFFGFMVFIGLGNGILLPNANAGMLSVRPALAGSAAGLGGAFMVGGGAALSVVAGFILGPGTGARPLVILMVLTTLASLVCAVWVLVRARQMAGRGTLDS
ncbi:multidrug effflux MFS transporter [Thalassorhabdomicrobium marinisediminis]|uniref:multidrug effflux MFS transporter n=1 Tax=Thalassorhabdomicrobium marinisediminis TaxID=2170577 RepID=UPI0024933489|nr:multidrug effflux MFS transporter [Thalassorhabdomicrobium marinisediminis]